MQKFFKMSTSTTNGLATEQLLIKQYTVMENLDRKDILVLHHAGIVRRIHGKKVTHVSDVSIRYVYFLQKGLMKISNINDNGEEVIKYILKPGNIFGELNLLDNEEDRHEIAVAMEECQVCFVPAETVKELMITNSSLRKSIHHYIGKRIKRMEERTFSLMLKDVNERNLIF